MIIMKKIKILKFFILVTSLSFAQNNLWTLEECVSHAVEIHTGASCEHWERSLRWKLPEGYLPE